MMTQKDDPCIKLFSTSSRVRMVSWILSQLNILCTTLVNHTALKIMIHRLFTVDMLRRLYVFSNVSDFIEAVCIKTFSTLSGVRIVFWILRKLHILCTSAVKWNCVKNYNSPFTCRLFSSASEFVEAKETCHRVVRTSIWLISYCGELCNKKCIIETSETLIIWSAFSYTAGSEYSGCYKRGAEPTAKRAVMVSRVHSRHVEFLLTYRCS